MERDNLFTNIHKAIRVGLFDLITTAGATDWSDARDVDRFADKWQRMHALLDDHSHHEDDHILRILDPHDPAATEAAESQHHTLDSWLDELAAWVDAIVADAAASANSPVDRSRPRKRARSSAGQRDRSAP